MAAVAAQEKYEQEPLTTVHRLAQRATYNKDVVHAILDEAFICHLSYVNDDGYPVTVPAAFARDGDALIFHGHPSTGFMLHFLRGDVLSVAVTLLDGIVMARSAFHSSMNYRSIVAFGTGEVVDDPLEKIRCFQKFTEHIIANRWKDARPPSEEELDSTVVVRMPLVSVSCKQRSGPAGDDDEDIKDPMLYAGVLPLKTVSLPHTPDPDLPASAVAPHYVVDYFGPGVVPLNLLVKSTAFEPASRAWLKSAAVLLIGISAGFAASKYFSR